jgi:hypothetical protein
MNATQALTTATTLIAAIGALIFSLLNYLHSRRTLRETRLAERRKTLEARLNNFYGPLLTYMNVIFGLYRLFVIGKPAEFRTLTYLLDREQEYQTESGPVKVVLTESDRSLFAEILELEKETEQHIIKNCGLVEEERLAFHYIPDPKISDVDPEVFKNLGLLSILVTHFRVLRMAYEGKITSDITRYEAFVYPRELDDILRETIKKLQQQLRELGGEPEGLFVSLGRWRQAVEEAIRAIAQSCQGVGRRRRRRAG